MDGRSTKPRKPSPFGDLARRLENRMTPREEAIHLHLLIEQKREKMRRLRQQMRELRSQLGTLRRAATVGTKGRSGAAKPDPDAPQPVDTRRK